MESSGDSFFRYEHLTGEISSNPPTDDDNSEHSEDEIPQDILHWHEAMDQDLDHQIARNPSVEILQEVHPFNTEHQSMGGDDHPGETSRRRWLREECNRRPYLDGTYFEVDYEKSDKDLDGNVEAVCQLCTDPKRIRGPYAISSNFVTHIRRKHEDQMTHYNAYVKRKLEERVTVKGEATCEFAQKEFDTNMTNWLLSSPSVPVSEVEKPAFKKIFDDMKIKRKGRSLRIINRKTMVGKMKAKSRANLQRIKKEILQDAPFTCTTVDIWTHNIRRVLGATVHWIDKKTLQRKSAAIACRRFTGTHSHNRIARLLDEIQREFGLNREKNVATVSDNGSNFVAAFKQFGIDLPDDFFYEEIPLNMGNLSGMQEAEATAAATEAAEPVHQMEIDDSAESAGEDPTVEDEIIYDEDIMIPEALPDCDDREPQLSVHLRCGSHTLSIIATADTTKILKLHPELLEMNEEAMKRLKVLWNLLRSAKQREKPREILGVALRRPIVVRWNSFFDAVSQILALKDKLPRVYEEYKLQVRLRECDLEYLKNYIECMTPIATALDFLQGEKKMYYGYLLPTIVTSHRKLVKLQQKPSLRLFVPLLKGLIESLERRFKVFFSLEKEGITAALAAFSHPEFKWKWRRCFTEEIQTKITRIVTDKAYEELEVVEAEIPIESEPQAENEDFFDFGESAEAQENSLPPVELDKDPQLILLKYSRDRRTNLSMLDDYPLVRKMFLRYNTPLAASSPVERLFNYATMIDIPKFNRLKEDFFEVRVLGSANAKFDYKY